MAVLGLALAAAAMPLLILATIAAPREDGLAVFLGEHAWLAIAYAAVSAVMLSLSVAWLVGLRSILLEHSRRWLVLDCALVLGVFGFVATLVAYPLLAAIAYASPGPELATSLLDSAFVILNVGTGPPSAISVAAFTYVLLTSDLRNAAVAAAGAVVVVAHLALALAFVPGELFSPTGAITWLAPLLYYAWLGLVSLKLLRG